MMSRLFRLFRHPFQSLRKIAQKCKTLRTNIVWQICVPVSLASQNSIHVDLGSGSTPRNPLGAKKIIGTDFHSAFLSPEGVEFIQVDLTGKLPFLDDSIDSMSAYDVLEHIPRWERSNGNIQFPFIHLMNEIHRSLKPGGIFLAVTPAFPSPAAFQDPTHVNFISTMTVQYFSGSSPMAANLKYGFEGNFKLICQTWIRNWAVADRPTLSIDFNSKSKSQKIRFLLSLSNVRKLFKLIFAPKPSHLLWVLEKPAQ